MMYAHFGCRITVAVECATCPEPPARVVVVDNLRLNPLDMLPYPTLPLGWRVVDGNPICDRHEVMLTDKDPAPAAVPAPHAHTGHGLAEGASDDSRLG